MHEIAATQAMLAVVLDAAARAGGRRVLAVDVSIGELTSMIDDSVAFYFELLGRETPAAGALLRLRREPALATCSGCGHTAAVRPPLAAECTRCGARTVTVHGGQSFTVESIEVADEDPGGHAGAEGER